MKKNIIVFVFIIFILNDLSWLALTLTLFAIIYFGMLKVIFLMEIPFFKKSAKRVFIFIFLFSIVISSKLLVFDIYKIPSSSMKNTLFPNDVIVVNKLKYGPRLPRSPFDIPLVNIGYYFNENARKRIKQYWWPYKRLSSTTEIKQGDVIVFNSNWRKDFFLVKRCVALPGDTLNIEDGAVYTNSTYFNNSKNVKHNYTFNVINKKGLYRSLDSLGFNSVSISQEKLDVYQSNLSQLELERLKKTGVIENVKLKIDTLNRKGLFFQPMHNNWSLDNTGPVIVPKKGMQITLNEENFSIYKKAIRKSEKCKLAKRNGAYYINNKKAETYTFTQDYYFMMGDNRNYSNDSRYYGFVPIQNIVGKVQCVLYSNYQDKLQWNRFFKSIN
ncbi:MAG: signal peptidase I [Polaribacter sp.]|uniref:signal peptidase I n=1 Tax=Polaribacter sp. TaxID=1920175 RepID=UPI003263950D